MTGELSNAIVDAIPPEWLCAAYPGLHDLDLAQAVEKVAKEVCHALQPSVRVDASRKTGVESIVDGAW